MKLEGPTVPKRVWGRVSSLPPFPIGETRHREGQSFLQGTQHLGGLIANGFDVLGSFPGCLG